MLDKVRVFEIAEEAGSTSYEVMQKAKELGIILKTAFATVSYDEAENITEYIMTGKKPKIEKKIDDKIIKPNNIEASNFTNHNDKKHLINTMTVPKRKGLVIIKKKIPDNKEIKQQLKNHQSYNQVDKHIKNEDVILENFPDITITIENLKNISELKWKVHKENGIYGIIGENGVGKSSLLTCLAQLINKETFKNEFSGVGYYDNSKITYSFNDNHMTWIKNKNTENNWRQDTNDQLVMPTIDGFFESSILNGKRFNKVDNYIKNDLEFRHEDIINKASDFIINEMNYILYGNKENLYKFHNLVQIKAKRRKIKKQNTMLKKYNNSTKEFSIKEYKYYALKLDDYEKKFLKEYLFSTGEYILLQLLKFLNDYVNKNNLIPKLIVIDEIEIALHPLAQERLIEKLKIFCTEYNLIVIFATHSFHIIEQINKKNRFFIYKDDEKKIQIENNVNMGYLNTKLYKHQFFDYILLVEDRLSKKYLECTLSEIFELNIPRYEIITIGGADKVFEINRENKIYKYFGDAKIISIPDEDKKDKFKEYKDHKFIEIYIPVEKNIEDFIYKKYKMNDNKFVSQFEEFVNKKYYRGTLNSFKKIYEEKSAKNFFKDIGCQIARETKNPINETIEIFLSNEITTDLVEFIFTYTNMSNEFKSFKGKLKSFFDEN